MAERQLSFEFDARGRALLGYLPIREQATYVKFLLYYLHCRTLDAVAQEIAAGRAPSNEIYHRVSARKRVLIELMQCSRKTYDRAIHSAQAEGFLLVLGCDADEKYLFQLQTSQIIAAGRTPGDRPCAFADDRRESGVDEGRPCAVADGPQQRPTLEADGSAESVAAAPPSLQRPADPGSGTDSPGSGTDSPGSGTDSPGSGTDSPLMNHDYGVYINTTKTMNHEGPGVHNPGLTVPPPTRRPPALRDITPERLSKPAEVQSMYAAAVEMRLLVDSDANRLRVFALAHSVVRRQAQMDRPGAAFFRNVERREWGYASSEDDDWAAAAVKSLDGRHLPRPAAPAAYVREAEESAAIERQKLALLRKGAERAAKTEGVVQAGGRAAESGR